MTNMYDDQVKTTAALNEAEVPDYVWDILKAWADGEPLNFQGHAVPEVVQQFIEKAVSVPPRGFVVPAILQNMCVRFLNDTVSTNWTYMAREQFTPGVRWIVDLARNDTDMAEESLEELREITQGAIHERDLGKTPQERSLGGQLRANDSGS